MTSRLGLRWTLGDVSDRGFEALRLSLWGAWRRFGADADYVVCVNTVPLPVARACTGPVPPAVAWRDANEDLPEFLADLLGPDMGHGMGWKLAPLRCFPDRVELSLDNDCILWAVPDTLAAWLQSGPPPNECLMAEDVRPCYGQFASQCPPEPRNAGLRGLPPGFDLEAALRGAVEARERETGTPAVFASDLDEQGLQVAALSAAGPLHAVSLQEVTVCSPFHPHLPHLGRCGAHFVGLNARHLPWRYYEKTADEWMAAHWTRLRPRLYALTGAPQSM